jgi:hypothetical protein
MFRKYVPIPGRIDDRSVFTLGAIMMVVILVTLCCVLSSMLYNLLKEPSPTPPPDIPVKTIPTAVMPVSHFLVNLPVILSGSEPISESEQTWKVTQILNQGYELGGQRYDLAVFTRLDGLATGQGYCINPGWAIPELGTEYLLTAEGIFVPVVQSDAHPIQLFSKIR